MTKKDYLFNENDLMDLMSPESYIDKSNLSEKQSNYLTNHFESIGAIDSITSNSIKLGNTTNKTPDWINLLFFQKNLEKAIDSLEDYDTLVDKELELLMFDLENIYYEFTYSGHRNSEDLRIAAIEASSISDFRASLNFRKLAKFIDLYEYFKAVLKGVDHLFYKGQEKYINGLNKYENVENIREELREILKYYQSKQKKLQGTIIPISLTSHRNGDILVSEDIKDKDKRTDLSTQINNAFNVNLRDLPVLKYIPNHRVLRIGIEVFDSKSVLKNEDKLSSFNASWTVRLEDKGNGLNLYRDENHIISDTIFSNISGDKDGSIVWSNNESLINTNLDREWYIEVLDVNSLGQKNYNIRDIVLHFQIVFEK